MILTLLTLLPGPPEKIVALVSAPGEEETNLQRLNALPQAGQVELLDGVKKLVCLRRLHESPQYMLAYEDPLSRRINAQIKRLLQGGLPGNTPIYLDGHSTTLYMAHLSLQANQLSRV